MRAAVLEAVGVLLGVAAVTAALRRFSRAPFPPTDEGAGADALPVSSGYVYTAAWQPLA